MNSTRNLLCFILMSIMWPVPVVAEQTYRQVCDASAGVAIGSTHFLMAADEYSDNGKDRGIFLFLYSRNDPGKPPVVFPLPKQLRADQERELDTEGAARIGDRIYWITSHGRNKKGKLRPNRYRLYATDVEGGPSALKVAFVGSNERLVQDMLQASNWAAPQHADTKRIIGVIEAASRLDTKRVEDLAPKKEGLNIEGLAAKGSDLLIGFRNPIPNGKALVVRLRNAEALVTDNASAGKFDGPFELDLGGRGIRGMAFVEWLGAFLLIAGPRNGDGTFSVFEWAGPNGKTTTEIAKLKSGEGISPEALIVYEGKKEVQVLNDQGTRPVSGKDCRKGAVENQSFTSQSLVVE